MPFTEGNYENAINGISHDKLGLYTYLWSECSVRLLQPFLYDWSSSHYAKDQHFRCPPRSVLTSPNVKGAGDKK